VMAKLVTFLDYTLFSYYVLAELLVLSLNYMLRCIGKALVQASVLLLFLSSEAPFTCILTHKRVLLGLKLKVLFLDVDG
jgi:hypothetical protein